MNRDEILKLSNDELNDKIEELLGNEVVYGYVFENKRISCPENLPGCLVAHYRKAPRLIRNFAEDIAEAWTLLRMVPDARWGVYELDEGGWTAFAMKRSTPGWINVGEAQGVSPALAIVRAVVSIMEENNKGE